MRSAIRLLVIFLILHCPMSVVTTARAAQSVTLQLKWEHSFQFAGYYAAKHLGYYDEVGLAVTINPATPATDVVGEVLYGRANFGAGSSSLMLDRHAGKPVVVLAVIFQHSPYVLIAARKTAGQSVHDLLGKRIMMEPLSQELQAYLEREGIGMDQIQVIPHTFDLQDLIDDKVDALAAYITVEPYVLDKAGFQYEIYSPRSVGVDFYGDNLFTSESELRNAPERVKAFRQASLRGWEYAMAHPQEIAELIFKNYAPNTSLQYQEYEAARMAPLVLADVVPVGYMNDGRWNHIKDIYAELGMLPRDFPLEGFLLKPEQQADRSFLYLS